MYLCWVGLSEKQVCQYQLQRRVFVFVFVFVFVKIYVSVLEKQVYQLQSSVEAAGDGGIVTSPGGLYTPSICHQPTPYIHAFLNSK